MPFLGRFSYIRVNVYTQCILVSIFLSSFLGASSLLFGASGTGDVIPPSSINFAKYGACEAHQLFYNPQPPPNGIQLLAEPVGFEDVDEEDYDSESEAPDRQLGHWLRSSYEIQQPVCYSAPCPPICNRKTAPVVPLFLLHNSWKVYQA